MYLTMQFDDLIIQKLKNKLLVATATDIESEYLHKKIYPLPQFDKILKVYYKSNTYYIGKFGKYEIVHVQCSSMGSIGRSSSLSTLIDSIDAWNSKAVIMIGIAYGIDSVSQKIGDVLISEAIITYEQRKISTTDIISRCPISEAGEILLNRFKNCREWSFKLPSGDQAKKIPGQILSGEPLIDNIAYKESLVKAFPAAKGGEMEGAGLYSAATSRKIEWLLVKGICDFADGNKSKNKDENQKTAISSAVDLCEKVLSTDCVLNDLGIVICEELSEKISCVDVNKILFSVYELSCEPYYIRRGIDDEFINALRFYGVWVYGPCGFGKTATLTRNLTISYGNYTSIDLSSCLGMSNDEIFYVVLLELCEIFSINNSEYKEKSQILKNIITILSCNIKSENKYLYFDELPISNAMQLDDFINKIAVINNGVNATSCKIKFIISTIEDPKKYLLPISRKISESIKFIEINRWEKTEIESLVYLIVAKLNISLTSDDLLKIIVKSKYNPRFIKCFFKNFITLQGNPKYTLDSIISETEQQVFI